MSLKNSIQEGEPYILVEGPKWGDAEFYGKWLLAAAKAEALWLKALKSPIFQKQVDRLTIVYLPNFSIAATVMISQLEKYLVSFAIQLNGEEVLVDAFVIMAEMGFFVLTGQRYQMAIPTHLNIEKVKKAALKFAQTEDDECYLHPEDLIATMPKTAAEAFHMAFSPRALRACRRNGRIGSDHGSRH
jgi:hypothetical protein